jgi:DNA-binding transcriptional regulator YhcF (GntR family)
MDVGEDDDRHRHGIGRAAVRAATDPAGAADQKRTLAVGTRLPTIRHLAADLGLAVNTVARAYRELEEAGLIETRGRAGSFVSAAGEEGRERARRAAADYAAVIASVGLDRREALRIVEAALS